MKIRRLKVERCRDRDHDRGVKIDPLVRRFMITDLERETRKAQSIIKSLRYAIDDLEEFVAGKHRVHDEACNAARSLTELFARCSRIYTLRETLACTETEETEIETVALPDEAP